MSTALLHSLRHPLTALFDNPNLFEGVVITLFVLLILAILAMSSWSLILIAIDQTAGGGPLGMVVKLAIKMANNLFI